MILICADDYAAVCLKVGRIPDKHKSVPLTGPKNKNGKKVFKRLKSLLTTNTVTRQSPLLMIIIHAKYIQISMSL